MRQSPLIAGLVAGLFAAGAGCSHTTAERHAAQANDKGWQQKFDVPKDRLSSAGRSQYFILEPGHQAIYEGEEDGETGRLIITVLNETKVVDGVETRVVEEREWTSGKLAEVSRNYFAIDKTTGDVYYFGEDVDMYKHGKITSHEGSWLSGQKGAHFGLALPGSPKVGQRYYQELAPDVAMDRAEIVDTTLARKVPAGEFANCVKTEETSLIEPGAKEYKVYAPGVGLAIDGGLKLVRQGKAEAEPKSN